jgi:hypothetical protein
MELGRRRESGYEGATHNATKANITTSPTSDFRRLTLICYRKRESRTRVNAVRIRFPLLES